jgi:catechol 2,3-dioxygenase-like lactoylglutathione lyase family enzyme
VASVSDGVWRIEGARHAGITVSDLDRSLEFYCGKLGLELLWRRLYEEREIA